MMREPKPLYLLLASLWASGMILALGAEAEPAPTKLFIQVWFDAGLPAEVNPDEDPGRVEITIKGEFVGCAQAPLYRPSAGAITLVPVSIGVTTLGFKADVKVETYGELRRVAKPNIKITELPR